MLVTVLLWLFVGVPLLVGTTVMAMRANRRDPSVRGRLLRALPFLFLIFVVVGALVFLDLASGS